MFVVWCQPMSRAHNHRNVLPKERQPVRLQFVVDAIKRAATGMIYNHGEHAEHMAIAMVSRMQERGDMAGSLTWHKIATEIRQRATA